MADMLGIGSLASMAYKKAIEVTSHNVANVGVEGYHRQRADIVTNSPQIVGTSFLGGGSKVDSVTRIYQDFIQNQLVSATSLNQRYDQQLQLSKQVEGIVASNDKGVQQFMQRFFDAMQNLANDPTTTTNRRLLLDEATNFESHIKNLSLVLKDTSAQTNNQIKDTVKGINQQLNVIQAINVTVQRALASGQQTPNDLLDKREEAIKKLGTYIDIKPFRQPNGVIDIHTADGSLPLISDNTVTSLVAKNSDYVDESRIEVFMNIGGELKNVSSKITGGQLGGVIDFRRNMLDRSQDELGVMLNGLVASTNWQHYQGYDINGNSGGDFFQSLKASVIHNVKNQGTETGSNIKVTFNPNSGVSEPPYKNLNPPLDSQPATYGLKKGYLDTAFSEIGKFQAREYEIHYRAATDDFAFYDHITGQAINNAAGAQVTIARGTKGSVGGLEFDFSNVALGAVKNGDQFLSKPHQDILKQFKTVLTDINTIATRGQSPVDTNNNGLITDEVPTPAAVGDNVNIANMANLAGKSLLYADAAGNASETLLGGYSKMATNVGLYVQGTQVQYDTQVSVLQQITSRSESLSGVNLDEEAANLLKFQQAYQAAAKIIQASQSMFTTIIGALRG